MKIKSLFFKDVCPHLQATKNNLLLICAVFIFTGCQTFQTNYLTLTEGQWEVRALIKDKARSNTYVAIIDVYAIKNEKLKMDLISPLGDHLGSFKLTPKKFELIDMRKRVYYTGPPSKTSFKPLFNLPINPSDFYGILFETKPESKGWRCQKTSGQLSECSNEKTHIKVAWSKRAGSRRVISIKHPNAELQLNFKKFKNKIKPGAFRFIKPKSFRTKAL